MDDQKNSIRVDKLSFLYSDGTPVLKDVNFKLEKGKCLALLGANGSGKSTLLYTLIGVIPHMISGEISGAVNISEFDVMKSDLGEIVRNVALVQQDPESQIISATIETECAFAPSNFGLDKHEIRNRITWALDAVGLQEYEKYTTQNLSYGQKQRLTIAAALTTKPKVLLLDEPLSNVDASSRDHVIAVLDKLKKDGMTLVISTHDIANLLDIVDYVLILSKNDGQLAFGTLEQILKNTDLFNKAKINLPPMIELGVELGLDNIPIHVEEMCNFLTEKNKFGLNDINSQERQLIRQDELLSNSIFGDFLPKYVKNFYDKPIIAIEDLCFSYSKEAPVLKNINLEIHKEELIGIIGPNGSGKTTLIKHLVGLLKPVSGAIFFHDKDINRLSVGQISKYIGVVLQNPDHQLVYKSTVCEEVAYGVRNINSNSDTLDFEVEEVLEMVDLKSKSDVYPGKLSFGEKKKLLLACMIVKHPEILILDEPFFGLDYSGKTGLIQILKSLNQKGQTIIIISHDIDTLSKCVQRFIIINKGQIILDGSTLDILSKPSLKEYGIEAPQVIQLFKCLENKGSNCLIPKNEI